MNLPLTRSYGGANKSNKILAEELAKKGHEVVAVTPALAVPSDHTVEELISHLDRSLNIKVTKTDEALVFTLDGILVYAVIDPGLLRSVLKQIIKDFGPDWILVSTEDPSQSLFRTAYEISPDNIIYLGHTKYMLPFGPLSFYPGEKRTALIKNAKSIITISRYNAAYIKKYSGIEAFVNHPPHFGTNNFEDLGKRTNEYVLMINPSAVKGICILEELAKKMQLLKFAIVPGWGTTPTDVKRLRKYSNIEFWQSTSDLNNLFQNVSVLIMPSLWIEGFGMIVVDALIRGVPVVSSKHGGLMESKLGTNYQVDVNPIAVFKEELDENKFPVAIVPEQNIEPWVRALEELLNDDQKYRTESKLSRERASAFISGLSIDPLIEHLKSLGDKNNKLFDDEHSIDAYNLNQKALLIERLKEKKLGEMVSIRDLKALEKKQYYDVSYSQKQALYIDEIAKGYYGFILGGTSEINEKVERKTLEEAFNNIVRRNEAFRTRFRKVGGDFKQQVLDTLQFKIEYIHLSGKDRSNQLEGYLNECFRTRFDLKVAPLLRIYCFTLEEHRYLLAVAMHHIISDGTSMNILVREIIEEYNNCLKHLKKVQHIKPVQYKDYVAWQTRLIQTAKGNRARQYWHTILSGNLPLIDLPVDHIRPVIKTFNGREVVFSISHDQLTFIRNKAKLCEVSTFTLLVSFVYILLYRYSGQEDLIIGTPVANRDHPLLEDQIGYFVNMVVLRNRIASDETLDSLLQRVKRSILEALSFGYYPFDKLIEEILHERDLSRSPIFDVMVSMSAMTSYSEKNRVDIADAKVGNLKIGSSHDLAFIFRDAGETIEGKIVFNIDIFSEAKVLRMSHHFLKLIESSMRDPTKSLGKLDLLSVQELQELLQIHDNDNIYYPRTILIHEKFEEMANLFPDRIACLCEEVQLSYSLLNSCANAIATEIRKRSIGRNDIVAIYCDHSIESVVFILAVLKAGAGYLPLNPNFPSNRIKFYLQDNDCKLILITSRTKGAFDFEEIDRMEISINSFSEGIYSNLRSVNVPTDVSYIIYTSGSSGVPKGVIITHENVMRLFFNDKTLFDFNKNDIWSLFHSISFDFSVWEIFGALLFGGRLAVIGEEVRKDIILLVRLLIKQAVTILNIVPGVFYTLLLDQSFCNITFVPFKYIIFGGDVLRAGRLKEFYLRFPYVKYINMYGITETTVHVTFKEIGLREIDSPLINIGLPIPTTSVLILDKNKSILPKGILGEIHVGGAGVSRGYLNEQTLTSLRFISNPLKKNEVLYCSGDLGRTLENGDIEYVGRKDNQVQIRGFRIELNEISNVIKEYGKVKDVIVIDNLDIEGDPIIVAFIISNELLSAFLPDLRGHISSFLPKYMIPSHFVQLDCFPLTENGKLDKKALLSYREYESMNEFISPTSELEENLFAIWKDVLGYENFGVEHDFFEIGGHSLNAIKVTALIYKRLNFEIRLGDFFENPTIKELASFICFIRDKDSGNDFLKDEVEIVL